jgi:hypothetical protein
MAHKLTRQWLRLIQRTPGFTVRHTGSGHLLVRNAEGQTTVIPSSPSDARSWRNSRADLRKLGLDI